MEEENRELKRNLKNRHIQMIALGGAIGTGLFYGSGTTIQLVGPAITLSYILGGIVIFFIMRALGEMTVSEPVSGSFSHYAYEYWGDFPGFLSGWNYWFDYVIVSMAELAVVGSYINHWFPGIPQWASALFFLVFITFINFISVKAFGEFEFWFALIKVVAIVGMIVGGLLIVVFGLGIGAPVGLSNLWINGGFMPKGIMGLLLSLVMVMFSFGGVELIGITAGEADNPKKTIPKAINQVVWRILIFYVGALTVIMAIFPWDQLTTSTSPFVQIFTKLGISSAASILNLVALTACLSAYNSALYSNARMLYGLALQKSAPKAFGVLSKSGVPIWAVLFSSGLTLIAVVLSYILPGKVFIYFASIAAVACIINWGIILITQLKYRKKIGEHGKRNLEFKLPFAPYSSYISLAFLLLVIVLTAFIPDMRCALYIVSAWIGCLFIGYKVSNSKKIRHLHNSSPDGTIKEKP